MMMHEAPDMQARAKEHELPAHATTEALTLGAISPLERNQMPANAARHIPRWKMVLITLIPVYTGSTLLGLVLFALFPDWPFPFLNGLMSLVLVVLLTYVTQPVAVRLLSGWLYAPPQQGRRRAMALRRLPFQGSLLLILLPISLRNLTRRSLQTWLPSMAKPGRMLPFLASGWKPKRSRPVRSAQAETTSPGERSGFLAGFFIGFALGLCGGIILHGVVAHTVSFVR